MRTPKIGPGPVEKLFQQAGASLFPCAIAIPDKESPNRSARRPAWLNLVENDKFKQRPKYGVPDRGGAGVNRPA